MTPALKKIVSAVLLVFVGGSLAWFVVSETAAPAGGAAEFDPLPANAELIVYYLSEGKDCSTCQYLDAYTLLALETYFGDELAEGRIVWRTADMDLPAHKHFVTDYDLYTKSVVLVRVENGVEGAHRNLERIWDHVYDKDAFLAYIRTEIEDFTGGGS